MKTWLRSRAADDRACLARFFDFQRNFGRVVRKIVYITWDESRTAFPADCPPRLRLGGQFLRRDECSTFVPCNVMYYFSFFKTQ